MQPASSNQPLSKTTELSKNNHTIGLGISAAFCIFSACVFSWCPIVSGILLFVATILCLVTAMTAGSHVVDHTAKDKAIPFTKEYFKQLSKKN